MFVIELTYKAPLAKIDAHMAAHVAFLKKYYAAGNFLVSGRQVPRIGGIILAVGESPKQIAAIMDDLERHVGAAAQSDDITILALRYLGPQKRMKQTEQEEEES